MGLSRRAVLLLGAGGATAVTWAAVQEPAGRSAENPVLAITEHSPPVPADATWIHPNGSDDNPGTEAEPRATPMADATNVLAGGTYGGFSLFAPHGTTTTLLVPQDATAVLDGGGGTERALTAGGVLN